MKQGCSTKFGRIITSAMLLVATAGSVISSSPNLKADCTPPPAGLVAWWQAEGNANDTAGTNNGTLVGATFVAGESGQSFNFNGANQKITIPDNDSLKLTNSLSIEGWIYPRANGFILFRGDSRPGLDPYALSVETTHELQFEITSDAGQSVFLRTPGPITMNQWAHVAATLDGTSGIMRLYLNGTLAAETNTLLRPLRNLDPASSPGVAIGGHAGTYNYFSFDGMIDELSVYSRALTINEIQAIYAAGNAGKCVPIVASCTPPPTGLVGWWSAEGNANDIAGGNNATFSSSGVAYASGKVGQGFRFDGTNGYLQIPDSAALKPTNLTVEAWVWLDPNLPANRGSEQIVFKKNTWSAWFEGYSLLKVTIDNGNGTYSNRFEFTVSRNGNQVVLRSITLAQRGVWYHVAGTYDGNKSIIYVNGVAEASATPGFALDYDTTPIYIGTSGTWAPYLSMFGGIIDEPSIYNRALSTNEIAAIYAVGSAGKCLPAAPVVISGPITNSANSHSYYLLSGSTWTEAEAKAVTLGGHLVTINDATENAWV